MHKTIGHTLFSSGLQNPKFTVQESKGVYEVRTSHATYWVSTAVTGMEQDSASSTGFRKLFKYIQGTNEKKSKVEMTAPVNCMIDPGLDLPVRAPSPTYGGFANSESSREELLKLMECLKSDEMKFKETPYYRAGYDSPFKLTNRRNEVWLIKDEEE